MLTAGEVLLGMGIFFGVLWLPLIAVFAAGKLNERSGRANGNGQRL